MKKNIFLGMCLLLLTLTACEENEIGTYSGVHNIFFEKFYMDAIEPGTEGADSTVVSFFNYPAGTQSIRIPLVVLLSGNVPTEDLEFTLKNAEGSEMTEGTDFTLDANYVFHARTSYEGATDLRDTIYVTVNRTSKMEGIEGARLVVELVPTDKLGVGQYEQRRAVIRVNTAANKPKWWNTEITNYVLGKYSLAKYQIFMSEIDTEGEMSESLILNSPDRVRELAQKFKKYLAAQEEPIWDADNNEYMKVLI